MTPCTKEICDMFGVDEATALRMLDAGFRGTATDNEIAANMFYDDSGLSGMFSRAKADFDTLKAEESLKK